MPENETVAVINMPIEELSKAGATRALCMAEVVLGHDRETDKTQTYFGRDRLDDWEAGRLARMPRVLRVSYDRSTAQFEYLAVAVNQLKGSCLFVDVDAIIRNRKKETARVLDAESGAMVTIPVQELTGEYIRANTLGEAQPVWVDPREIVMPGKVRHPPFGRARRQAIRKIRDAVHEVCPKTRAQWEAGFRRDIYPDDEIRVWQHIAYCYRHFTFEEPELRARQEVFDLILRTTLNGAALTVQNWTTHALSPIEVREIAAFVEGTWSDAEYLPVPAGSA